MQLLRTLIGYGAAMYLTLVLVLAGFGAASPRDGDDALLAQAGVPAPAVLVGMKSVSRQTVHGFRTAESRYYLALPRSLATRSVWVVAREEDGTSHVTPSSGAFWWVVGMALLSMAGVLWYWFRPEHAPTSPAVTPPPPGTV